MNIKKIISQKKLILLNSDLLFYENNKSDF